MDGTGAGTGIGNPLSIVQAGESLPFVFDRGGDDVEGWTCILQVRQFAAINADDDPEIERVIELDSNDQWSGFLTSVETDGLLSRGIYRMVGVLTNLTTDEQEFVPVRFELTNSW